MATVVVLSGALQGVHAIPVEVEVDLVDLLRRLPAVTVAGLPALAARETAVRVRSAITSAGLEFPRKRVVINLTPADIRKDGTSFDLPVALGILAADGQIPADSLQRWLIVGELSLGGALRPVRGALALAELAREQGLGLLLPRASAAAAALVPGVKVAGVDDLAGLVAILRKGGEPARIARYAAPEGAFDLAEVRGQVAVKRALEQAATTGQRLLMVGPPGCGKSLLARRLPTLLPDLSFDEALEVTKIHEAAGLHPLEKGIVIRRPFRAPHHTVSVAGLIGDRTLRPGEVSLAHHGVLLLDEVTEFSAEALQALGAIRGGHVELATLGGNARLPAAPLIVAAANPCPCGGGAQCRCSDDMKQAHERRLIKIQRVLGIDLRVDLEPLEQAALEEDEPAAGVETSAQVRARVEAARAARSGA